jgi:hypothetical protein
MKDIDPTRCPLGNFAWSIAWRSRSARIISPEHGATWWRDDRRVWLRVKVHADRSGHQEQIHRRDALAALDCNDGCPRHAHFLGDVGLLATLSLARGAQGFPYVAAHCVGSITELSSMFHLTPLPGLGFSNLMSTIIDISGYVIFF